MSGLKGTINTILAVDYTDVEDLINKYYFDGVESRKAYCFCAAEEVGNDSQHEFDIDGVLDEYDMKQINERKTSYMTYNYLNDLANKGIIDKGTYIISVYW